MFKVWLSQELDRRGVDSSVFSEYLVSLLEANENVSEYVLGILESNCSTNDVEIEGFLSKISVYFENPEQIELENVISNPQFSSEFSSPSPNHTNPESVIGTIPLSHSVDIADISLFDDDGLTDNTLSTELEGENKDEYFYEDEFSDLSSLAIDLEADLQHSYPSLIFSPHALYAAISTTSGDVYLAQRLIEAACYRCFILSPSPCPPSLSPPQRPCRHLLQSGRCLRSDCIFDHSFPSTPCKFWMLLNGCMADSCPFLHSLPLSLLPHSHTEHPQQTHKQTSVEFSSIQFPSLSSKQQAASSRGGGKELSYKDAVSRRLSESMAQSMGGSVREERGYRGGGRGPSTGRGSMKVELGQWVSSGD
jgi:hypothetical protein